MTIKANHFFKCSKKVKLLIVLTCLITITTLSLFHIQILNKRPFLNENFIQICQNKQTFNNDIAIWTLLTDDADYYGLGAIKLLKSIRKNVMHTKFDAYVLELVNKPIRPKRIREKMLRAGWRICQVNRIAPRDEQGTFGRFRDQFTKLLLFNITEFKVNYYFDSDTFVLQNIDDFFNIHQKFNSNVHKIGCAKDWSSKLNEWSSGFNMGVFVLKPNQSEFNRLIELKNDLNLTFETSQAEQGFLNVVYEKSWFDIGFGNNANLAVYTGNRDFWNANEKAINVIHYTMEKPWSCGQSYKEPCDLWLNFDV